ncbi:MAG: glutamate 5-kinase [Syntrophaceae bacterium]|nr:glutamate 5-kinase [Syntrophaceae bacterium]
MDSLFVRLNILTHVRRVVVKLGSSVVTTDNGLDRKMIKDLADDIHAMRNMGKEFIIVSSGAVAAGVKRLGMKEGARTIPQKQAAAAVGQSRLMSAYDEAFGRYGIRVAQMLLTRDDLTHRQRYLNARNTLMTLLSWGVIPIINENDTVVVDEIKLGDNDNLSALVAVLASADLLLTLTDIEGLMDCDPRVNCNACLIPVVETITPELKHLAGGTSSRVGRGGMASKLEAASKAQMSGVPMIITRGKVENVVRKALSGESCGTLILPAKEKISARKSWIRYNLRPEGAVKIDKGAAQAITHFGKSLLPIGIVDVEGSFDDGAAVDVIDQKNTKIAVGLANYSSDEMRRILGRQTAEIDWILGYRRYEEAIHADNLVIL